MAIAYEQVVPWGRSYNEYLRMFGLHEADLDLRILGCGDGPAAFNAEMHARERHIVSVDPIYGFSRAQLEARIHETYDVVLEQTRRNQHLFRWREIADPDVLGQRRMEAMRVFLDDFEGGFSEGRYIPGELPHLPFEDERFDLVLCSHFLFLYSDNLDRAFHMAAIEEMRRVGREVRIFPVLDTNARVSAHLDLVMKRFQAELVNVDYEFQIGGNQMLVIR